MIIVPDRFSCTHAPLISSSDTSNLSPRCNKPDADWSSAGSWRFQTETWRKWTNICRFPSEGGWRRRSRTQRRSGQESGSIQVKRSAAVFTSRHTETRFSSVVTYIWSNWRVSLHEHDGAQSEMSLTWSQTNPYSVVPSLLFSEKVRVKAWRHDRDISLLRFCCRGCYPNLNSAAGFSLCWDYQKFNSRPRRRPAHLLPPTCACWWWMGECGRCEVIFKALISSPQCLCS